MRPVRRIVFFEAVVQVPGKLITKLMMDRPDPVIQPLLDRMNVDEQVRTLMRRELLREALYQDSPVDLIDSVSQRIRPQSLKDFSETCPLSAWPDVSSTYILMQDDRVVGPAWSRQIVPERLGRP